MGVASEMARLQDWFTTQRPNPGFLTLAGLSLVGALLAVRLGWKARGSSEGNRPSRLAATTGWMTINLGTVWALLMALSLIGATTDWADPLFDRVAPKAAARATSLRCVTNLKNVSLAVRLYATDWNDTNPPSLLVLSNDYLPDARMLVCPSDASRPAATNWTSVTSDQVTYLYFVGNTMDDAANQGHPMLLCPVHHHVVLGDGTVVPPGPGGIEPRTQSNWVAEAGKRPALYLPPRTSSSRPGVDTPITPPPSSGRSSPTNRTQTPDPALASKTNAPLLPPPRTQQGPTRTQVPPGDSALQSAPLAGSQTSAVPQQATSAPPSRPSAPSGLPAKTDRPPVTQAPPGNSPLQSRPLAGSQTSAVPRQATSAPPSRPSAPSGLRLRTE